MRLGDLFQLAKESVQHWAEDKVARHAAALAFFTMFSIAPLLIVVIAVAGAVFGPTAARDQLDNQIRGLVGETGAAFVQDMVNNANQPRSGTIATVIGITTLILGASASSASFRTSLDTIWGVTPRPQGLWGMIRTRFLSFTLVLGIGFLLLVSLVISALLSGVDSMLNNAFPGAGLFLRLVNFAISFGLITLLFAMMYKVLPDVKIAWSDVWIGATVTALLFAIGKFAIGLYLGNSGVTSVYGAAGSLVVVLLWVYYSAQILLLGAEFTQVYATRYGSRIVPTDNAVALTDEARARQGMPRKAQVDEALEREGAAEEG